MLLSFLKKICVFLNFVLDWASNRQPHFLWVWQWLVKNWMFYNKVAKLDSGSKLQLYFGEQLFWKNYLGAAHRFTFTEELTTTLSYRTDSVTISASYKSTAGIAQSV